MSPHLINRYNLHDENNALRTTTIFKNTTITTHADDQWTRRADIVKRVGLRRLGANRGPYAEEGSMEAAAPSAGVGWRFDGAGGEVLISGGAKSCAGVYCVKGRGFVGDVAE